MHRIAPPPNRGFTLVEVLTTTTLIAIMASIAVPAFEHIRLSSLRYSAAQQIRSLLLHARSTAVERRRSVSLCASQDGSSCTRTEVAHFIVFIDDDLDGAADASEVIRREAAVMNVRYVLNVSSRNSFRFRPDGTAQSYGHVVLCPSADQRYAAKLIVNSMGRTRSARDRDGDGFPEDSNGTPLDCPS